MSEDGYTLAEALAALLIIGLAIGGFMGGVQVIGRFQRATEIEIRDATRLRQAEQAIARLVQVRGPFRSDEQAAFSGNAESFSFACDAANACKVAISQSEEEPQLEVHDGAGAVKRMRIPAQGDLHFEYRARASTGETWPRPSERIEHLKAVALVTEQADPLLNIRVWSEQREQCQFDPIMQDCR